MTTAVKPILDPACGSKMMWQDKNNPLVIFGDIRKETLVLPDASRGNRKGYRKIIIDPDVELDFTNLPFEDESFNLVVFDPPHLVRAGDRSWLKAKYGKLNQDWQEQLRSGFSECYRVLKKHGTLIFKWNETQIKISEVMKLISIEPLFGHLSGRQGLTHWLVFFKDCDKR